MNRPLLWLTAAVLAVLCACGQAEQPADDGFLLWFPAVPDPDRPVAQALSTEPFAGQDATVDTLMSSLLQGPLYDGMTTPFLPNTRLLGWTADQGTLFLDMSAAYGDLTGVSLTLADYCITLTLCQLEGIDQVCITVNGQEVPGRQDQLLSPDNAIFIGAEEEPRQVSAEFYFPRAVGKGLGFEVRELTLTEDDDLYVTVTKTLMAGPEDPDLQAILPEGVELKGAWVDDGICFVNFSAALLDFPPELQEEQRLLLYSVVDTLGNLKSVTAVQLLVEGEIIPVFGAQDTSLPLEPDFGFVSGAG